LTPELPDPGNGGDEFEPDEAAPCRVQPGDVWLIGGVHRLICGDCTDPATVARLMQGERADAVVTDPPYAIYGSSTGIGGDVVDDNMVQPFMRSLFQVVTKNTSLGAHIYVFCDWRSYASWWNVSKPFPLIVRNCIVWDKGDGGLGSMYTMRHEFVVFFEHIQKHVTMTKANATRNARMVHGRSNVQRFNVVQGKERLHNAVKPLQLIEGLIGASSDSEHIILDPFLGSGTTIIAAHRTGRRCYGCEISEAYCEVILQRCEAEGLSVEKVEA
jgi:DNA modification methylase